MQNIKVEIQIGDNIQISTFLGTHSSGNTLTFSNNGYQFWGVAKPSIIEMELAKIRMEKIHGIFSCHNMITKVKYIFILVGPYIYQSNNLNNKSHKFKHSNGKENTIISKTFQKVFVGSEFWGLVKLSFSWFQNLGCYN